MAAKLCRSMVARDRSALAGLVEVDETEIVCRSKNDPLTGVAVAVIRARSWSSGRSRSRMAAPRVKPVG